MMTETNIFRIANLSELSTRYRTYKVRGLSIESPDFYKNRHHIVGRLSRLLKQPVEMFEEEGDLFLGVPEEAERLPDSMIVTRADVRFDELSGIRVLDYTARAPSTDLLCTRFIDFLIQAPLRSRQALWRPSAGSAFHEKTPLEGGGSIGRHDGFTVRSTIMNDGGIGLCIDSRSCYVDKKPLASMTRSDFRRLKGRNAIYRMGHEWFAIHLFALNDLKVGEVTVPVPNGARIGLADFIESGSRKPIPPELARLDPAGQVVTYMNTRGDERSAPSALCHLVYDTESREVRRAHGDAILSPAVRRARIAEACRKYISEVRIGETAMKLAPVPASVPRTVFSVPDMRFGGDRLLSMKGSRGARKISPNELGKAKREMLSDRKAGFFVGSQLDRQYVLLPRTVVDSWGSLFITHLRREVSAFYPNSDYDPVVVPYDDVGVGRTFVDQARAILAAAEQQCRLPGFAVVMIHEIQRGGGRAHDQLEAAILREFPKRFDVRPSVMHSSKGQDSYEHFISAKGEPAYRLSRDKTGVFGSYVKNVALSKVLLLNEKWPFVLDEPLHADVIVGVDVKKNTAGYTLVSDAGKSVRFRSEASRQAEKLLEPQIRAQIEHLLKAEFEDTGRSLGHVVVHRDGRSYPEERAGLESACDTLRSEGILREDAQLTIIEIHKSSPSPLRFFDVREGSGGRDIVDNPTIGLHYVSGKDGYLATTGLPFRRPGTSRPLHVRHVQGPLGLIECMEDVFRLSNLTWSRPEDCLRLPITIKLTDRVLGEEATDYNEDLLKFGEASERESA